MRTESAQVTQTLFQVAVNGCGKILEAALLHLFGKVRVHVVELYLQHVVFHLGIDNGCDTRIVKLRVALDHRRLVTGVKLVVDTFVEVVQVRFAELVFLACHVGHLADLEGFDPRFLQIFRFQNFVFHGLKDTRIKANEDMTLSCPMSEPIG